MCGCFLLNIPNLKRCPRKYTAVALSWISKASPGRGSRIGELVCPVPSRCCSTLQFLPYPQGGFQEKERRLGNTRLHSWHLLASGKDKAAHRLKDISSWQPRKKRVPFLCGLFILNCLRSCYVPFPSTLEKIHFGFLFEKSQSAVSWLSCFGQNIQSGECDVEAAVHFTWQCLRSRGEGRASIAQLPLSRPCSLQHCHPSVTRPSLEPWGDV